MKTKLTIGFYYSLQCYCVVATRSDGCFEILAEFGTAEEAQQYIDELAIDELAEEGNDA